MNKITRATYATIPALLTQCLPFTHGSCRAYWEGDTYRVYSYNTLIATAVQSGYWTTFNDRKYSMTTSRLQNIVKRVGVVL